MQCFAELVRLVLGASAIADRKLSAGLPLDILGVTVDICAAGMRCRPSAEKVAKWCNVITQALRSSRLTAGEASKLAGGLAWAGQNMFARCACTLLLFRWCVGALVRVAKGLGARC
jgi:hypothetical protein